jgi:hypothetical protein
MFYLKKQKICFHTMTINHFYQVKANYDLKASGYILLSWLSGLKTTRMMTYTPIYHDTCLTENNKNDDIHIHIPWYMFDWKQQEWWHTHPYTMIHVVYGCVCHHSCCFQSNMYHGIWVCMSSFLLFSVIRHK